MKHAGASTLNTLKPFQARLDGPEFERFRVEIASEQDALFRSVAKVLRS